MLRQLLDGSPLLPAALLWNLLLGAWLLCHASGAQAALDVAVISATQSDGYAVTRHYGGSAAARRISELGFRQGGVLYRVHADEGDRVSAGALLAELDPEPLQVAVDQAQAAVAQADADAAVARANLELAEQTRLRIAELVERGHASEQSDDEARLERDAQAAQVKAADARLNRARADLHMAEVEFERSRIHAPYDAVVQRRSQDEGSMLMAGQNLLRIVEAGAMEARIGLPADVAMGLTPGSRHDFRTAAGAASGQFRRRLPEVDTSTRTVTLVFDLDLDARELPAGSMVELALQRSVAEPGFWLPLSALSEAQRGLWGVYVINRSDGQDITERRLVEVIHTEGDQVFVRGTLRTGDRVVSTGTQRIVPGQSVNSVASSH